GRSRPRENESQPTGHSPLRGGDADTSRAHAQRGRQRRADHLPEPGRQRRAEPGALTQPGLLEHAESVSLTQPEPQQHAERDSRSRPDPQREPVAAPRAAAPPSSQGFYLGLALSLARYGAAGHALTAQIERAKTGNGAGPGRRRDCRKSERL